MADPQPDDAIDDHDRRTVAFYRLGLALTGASLGGLASEAPFREVDPENWAVRGLVAGVGLSVLHLHLYDRRIRWFLGLCAWMGAWLALTGLHIWATRAGLGALFVVVSGLALKERFCFKIPGLGLVPWALALGIVAWSAGPNVVAGASLAVATAFVLIMAVVKGRQPVGFDVGDKTRYDVGP